MQLSTLRIISIWQSIHLMVIFKPKSHRLELILAGITMPEKTFIRTEDPPLTSLMCSLNLSKMVYNEIDFTIG